MSGSHGQTFRPSEIAILDISSKVFVHIVLSYIVEGNVIINPSPVVRVIYIKSKGVISKPFNMIVKLITYRLIRIPTIIVLKTRNPIICIVIIIIVKKIVIV